jgi:hypothetical protein
MKNIVKVLYQKAQNHEIIFLYIIFIIAMLFNIFCVYLLYVDIPSIQDGALAKIISSNSNTWFYKSEDLMILRHKILISVSLLSVFFGLFLMYKRIKFACLIQIIPILFILLEMIFFK